MLIFPTKNDSLCIWDLSFLFFVFFFFHRNYMQICFQLRVQFKTGSVYVQARYKKINIVYWVKRMVFLAPTTGYRKFLIISFEFCQLLFFL